MSSRLVPTCADANAERRRGRDQTGFICLAEIEGTLVPQFHWQNGYGAFSVSQSAVKNVRDYIRDQAEHHRWTSFQDEFRAFLKRREVEFDERYVWD